MCLFIRLLLPSIEDSDRSVDIMEPYERSLRVSPRVKAGLFSVLGGVLDLSGIVIVDLALRL